MERETAWRTGRAAFPVIVLAAGMAIVLAVLWQLLHVLLLVFAAILAAVILTSLSALLSRLPLIGERLAMVLSVLLAAAFFVGFFLLLGSQIRTQFVSIFEEFPRFLDRAEDFTGIADLERIVVERTKQTLEETSIVSSFAGLSSWFLGTAAELLLVLVGGIYFAADPGLYRRGLLAVLPRRTRPRAVETLDALHSALRMWLLGKLAAMAIVGSLTGLGLWLLGVPSALALAVIAGVLEFVPYVGPILSAAPAIVVAFSESPFLALWVAGLYLLIQQLEGNVITPLVEQSAVDVPPAGTLFAIVAGGVLLGPLGVMMAAPLLVVTLVLVKKLWVRDTLHEDTSLPGEDAS